MKQKLFFWSLLLWLVSGFSSELIAQAPFKYGQMRDSRDGQVYPTLATNSIVWFGRDLNYAARSSRVTRNGTRLYPVNVLGNACPPGWRLPSDRDWAQVALYFGGYHDLTKGERRVGKDPTSAYRQLFAGGYSRFNARATGYFSRGGYHMQGQVGFYWTSQAFGNAIYYQFNPANGKIFRLMNNALPSDAAFACRCVRNRNANTTRSTSRNQGGRKPNYNPAGSTNRNQGGRKPNYNTSRSVNRNQGGRRPQPNNRNTTAIRKKPGAVLVYLQDCKGCSRYSVILTANGRSGKGRRDRYKQGNFWLFRFNNVPPGNHRLHVSAPVGSTKGMSGYQSGKGDMIRPRVPFRPKQVLVHSGQRKNVTFLVGQ